MDVTQMEPKCPMSKAQRIPVTEEFIERNNFRLNRSEDEIVEYMHKNTGLLSFQLEVGANFLSYDACKPFLKKEYIEKVEKGEEKPSSKITDVKEAVQDFLDYMVFAWEKAEDERGLSSMRSVQKLGAWLWILGREDLEELIGNEELYAPYGAPALIAVCEELGIKVPGSLYEFAKEG